MKKTCLLTFFFSFCGLLLSGPAQAVVCPICIIGVGTGLGLSRYIGIDDSIAALWLGGLLMAVTMWTINWFNKKNIRFHGRKILIFIVYYGLTALSLWPFPQYTHFGHPLHTLWGIDKLILGIAMGSIFFFLGILSYNFLKNKNHGRAHFPLQKVVMSILPLIILSFIFYFITK